MITLIRLVYIIFTISFSFSEVTIQLSQSSNLAKGSEPNSVFPNTSLAPDTSIYTINERWNVETSVSLVILCYIMLCYVMLCCVMLCYVMLCYVMLCYVVLCYVMLCYVMLCYVMLCYVMLCYVMLCYVVLCYVMRQRGSH